MISSLYSNLEFFRYERKFYLEANCSEEIQMMLKFHPAIFNEIYHERRVNNIYFDSNNLENYFANIHGISRRLKVRIRWYGDLFGKIEEPQLELKLKHGQHIAKIIHPLKTFRFDNNFTKDVVIKLFEDSPLNEMLKLYLKGLHFTLLNSYVRRYFLSSDAKFRVTIDKELEFFMLHNYQNYFLHKITDRDNTIVELKYDRTEDDFAGRITNYFPFRYSRSSKYVTGIDRLYT